ncbi:hypothetical protein WOLCODRAFT_23337 [Wolfiporia cocos MD-104 SS10]|uniref:Ubiquitin-like domain-containing protein n=1 Tax=Wolfiporia cocos (strain MD-104) TaxID=742152 RepID=A0A2H3JP31_WOLCO|nr:hypothetical protein WOLCODRAFT_23337 [Wolfiporia cocos MD-104 SS10]
MAQEQVTIWVRPIDANFTYSGRPTSINVSSSNNVDDLKLKIQQKLRIQDVARDQITLLKAPRFATEPVSRGECVVLDEYLTISVALPVDQEAPTIVLVLVTDLDHARLGPRINNELVRKYGSVVIKVRNPRTFDYSDRNRNEIELFSGHELPDFVENYWKKLQEKRDMSNYDWQTLEREFDIERDDRYDPQWLRNHFIASSDKTNVPAVSASRELRHLLNIVRGGIGNWTEEGVKEVDANAIFFQPLKAYINSHPTETRVLCNFGTKSWPFPLIVQVDAEECFYSYTP